MLPLSMQVEYAMESVSHAGCVIGILAPGEAGTTLGKDLVEVSYCNMELTGEY